MLLTNKRRAASWVKNLRAMVRETFPYHADRYMVSAIRARFWEPACKTHPKPLGSYSEAVPENLEIFCWWRMYGNFSRTNHSGRKPGHWVFASLMIPCAVPFGMPP